MGSFGFVQLGLGVVWYIHVRSVGPRRRWVHSCSFCSFRWGLRFIPVGLVVAEFLQVRFIPVGIDVVGLIRVPLVNFCLPRDLWVHSGLFRCA